MNKPLPKTAVLLAAGRGKRLRPYTDSTPKPLLSVDGRPTLDFVMQAVANAGIERVCLVTHYLAEQIEAYIGDGSQWGMQSTCVHQPEMLGTAHALRCVVDAVPAWFDVPFLLSATDYLLPPMFLRELVDFYGMGSAASACSGQAEIAVSLKQLPIEQLAGRSSIAFVEPPTAHNFNIAKIIEKPPLNAMPSNYSANLIFILPSIITSLLAEMKPSSRGEYEIQTVINQQIMLGSQARGLLQATPAEWQSPNKKEQRCQIKPQE